MSLSHLSPYSRASNRFVGLSKNQRNVPQLLSIVNRKGAEATQSKGTTPTEPPGAKPTEIRRPKLKKREDTNNIINKPLAKLAMDDIDPKAPPLTDSEDEEGPDRADIQKANFGPQKKTNSPPQIAARPQRQTAQGTRASARAKSSQSSQSSSSASRRSSDDEKDPDELTDPERSLKRKSQDTTELGRHFEEPVFLRKPQRVTNVYGGRTTRTIKAPKSYAKKEENSPIKSFQSPPKDLLAKKQSESPQAKLRRPASEKSIPFRGSPNKKRIKSSLVREELKVESPEDERPKFIIPDVYSPSFNLKEEDDDKFETSGMSTIDRLSESPSPLPISSKALCSMCDQEVDEKVRKEFDAKHPGSRFNLRREQQFCQFHKRNSARKTWKTKGYPDINWNKLDKRIADRHKFLQAILEGGQSYYGDIFKNSVKSGQNRTLLKSESNMTPGYYGIRGLRVMTDNLTYKFSGLLRERAVQDRLISARGHTAYLQTVLVPELAVQLIKEDMSVTEEKARTIMEESTTVGELLHEEVKDVVLESEDEKDDESGDDSDLPEL
ncbi:RTC4-like domain containing protein [Rhypophila sp. PSN 637]